MTMQRMMAAGMLMLAGFLVPVGQAWALINPNFTPMHLVNQSDTILDVRFVPVKDGVITLQIQSALKGKAGAKTLALSLKNTAFKEQAQTVEKTINESGDRPGIFFVGKISEGGGAAGGLDGPGGPGGGDEGGGEKGFLHLNGQWIAFDKDKDAWSMNEISSKMLATWNGGTDMLRKEVDYILADPDAVVPCTEGVSWGTPQKFATVAGKVRAVMPVTLADGGNQVLFLAADAGDKLFEFNATARGLKDVSAAHKLSTKSTIATWGDLNGDGRMDLVSWDGEAVSTWIQDASGVLQAGAKLAKGDIKGGCLSLAVIDSGVIGHPAVLIGTAATPLLWTPAAAAEPQVAKPVAAGEAPVKDLGATGRSFVADFDGDGFADILHLFAKGSLVYKGKAVGAFDVPKPCTVALGAGTSDAFLGDFDGDGLLDVYTLGDNTQLWNNRGKMEFVNVMQSTGEMTYKGNTDSIWGATGDINGDGRQDVVFFHGSTSPHIFFNRGFRSFGLANGIDFDTTGVIPGISEGQQAGCWTGLNGDGIQELVMILKNGEAWFLPVETGSEKAGCVRVTLSSKAPYVGPVNVVGIRGKRMLGAWNVLPGVSEGFIAQNDAGPVSIKWQLPGGKPQSKEINVENAPVKLMLP